MLQMFCGLGFSECKVILKVNNPDALSCLLIVLCDVNCFSIGQISFTVRPYLGSRLCSHCKQVFKPLQTGRAQIDNDCYNFDYCEWQLSCLAYTVGITCHKHS